MSKLIYIAAPYTDPDPARVKGRMYAFDAGIAALLKEGQFPVSPLMNHNVVGRHTIPGDWEFWQHYSRRLLGRCDELGIVTLPGWDSSTGVAGEIELAEMLSLPIRHLPWDISAYREGVVTALAEEFQLDASTVSHFLNNSDQDVEATRRALRNVPLCL